MARDPKRDEDLAPVPANDGGRALSDEDVEAIARRVAELLAPIVGSGRPGVKRRQPVRPLRVPCEDRTVSELAVQKAKARLRRYV